MRVATSQMVSSGLALMLRQQREIVHLRDQLATGRRLLSPADDPPAAARVLDLDATMQRIEQFKTNGDVATSRLEQAESVLAGITDTVQRVRELAVRAGNTHLTNADRRFVAAEVRQHLGGLIASANARDANGEYLFAGYQTRAVPFTRDPAGSVVYNGDQGTRLLQIGAERFIADREPGDHVFMAIRNGNGIFVAAPKAGNVGTGVIAPGSVVDAAAYQPHAFRIVFTTPDTFDVIDDTIATTVLAGQTYVEGTTITFNGIETRIEGAPAAGDEFTVAPSDNQSLFATVAALAATLEAPADTPQAEAALAQGIARALVDLDQAVENLLATRATIGARLKAVDDQRQVNDDLELQLASVRSRLADLDPVEAAVRLSAEANALAAAQQAFVRTQGLSLFNFL